MKGRLTAKQAALILNGTEDDWRRYILRHAARGRRMPKLEPYMANIPAAAYFYAKWVIKGRWPEAEPVIAKDPWAINYAQFVIEGRWPEAEPYIMQLPWSAAKYAAWVICGKWPEAEDVIRRDLEAWNWYTDRDYEVDT